MTAPPRHGRTSRLRPAVNPALTIRLPSPSGELERYHLRGGPEYPHRATPAQSRVAYAAAHVVADPLAEVTSDGRQAIDWEATLAFRHHLWDLGLGVAEAMDTAQRGMGLDWPLAAELIRRTCAEATSRSGALVTAGAQTDHLPPGSASRLDQVADAYRQQCAVVEDAGARVVVMASRELCRIARGPDDYATVYAAVLSQLRRPAIMHWLGEAFDPALTGYWGAASYEAAAESCLAIIGANLHKVDGIKCSLLEQDKEIDVRRRLPAGVRMYTGDDFDYPTTIAGDGDHHSDALLGAFDFAAPAAAWSLEALDNGDVAEFRRRMEPTLPLSRLVFSPPTWFYKTGIVFLAYLGGYQSHFRMIGGLESGRSVLHLAGCFRLADQAGLLPDGALAVARMRHVLALAGVDG
jgi:Protein of unknown function (DUF993)